MSETSTLQVKGDMLVADVIAKWPLAADIMESYGLSCTGCSVNTMETIELGAKGHGMPPEKVEEMIQEINDAISSGKLKEQTAPVAQEDAKPLMITEKAATKAAAILKEQGKEGWGIKVTVAPGGCAGFTYGMDFAEKSNENDEVIKVSGQQFFVDKDSTPLLSGVTMDFIDSLQESGFKFSNPNAKASCGCGKSFS